MVTKKIILNELRSLVKQIIKEEIESSENKAINKIYSEYFIEKLDNALGKEKLFEEEEGEISEWFANLFWDYHYDDSVKKFINPNNNKLIDKIGKSYYGFSQFRTIGGIEIGYAKAQFDIDDNLYTDNLDEIINSIDILVN